MYYVPLVSILSHSVKITPGKRESFSSQPSSLPHLPESFLQTRSSVYDEITHETMCRQSLRILEQVISTCCGPILALIHSEIDKYSH